MSTSTKRPRARNFKTESLLQEVERRSVPHLVRLSQDEWPSDPRDVSLALSIVFQLLEREPMPSRNPSLNLHINSGETKEAIDMIHSAITAIFRPFVNYFKSRNRAEVHISALSVMEGNVSTLLRWLDFVRRESSWLFAHWMYPYSDTHGPMLAAQSLQSIYTLGIEADDTCPVVSMLREMVAIPASLAHLSERIQAFSKFQYQQFIGSAVQRLDEWDMLGREPTGLSTMNLLELMQSFIHIPTFAEWFARSGFAGKILRLARRYPHLQAPGKYGSRFHPLPVAVSTYLFPLEPFPVVLSYKVLPELLDSGLLETIADYLLSLPEGTEDPWYPWVGDDAKIQMGVPIPILVSMCVYRPILDATLRAKMALAEEKRNRLSAGAYRELWGAHWTTLPLYQRVWELEDAKSGIYLCDNMRHATCIRETPGPRKECAHCRAVVYCSEECQREDWEAFHKEECSGNRHYRITRQLGSVWVSHRYRAFLLSLLHRAVFSYEIGTHPEWIEPRYSDDGQELIYDERMMPRICAFHKARVEATKRLSVVHFNTLICPTRFHLQPISTVGSLTHRGKLTFHEDRFKAMFEEGQSVPSGLAEESGIRRRIRLALVGIFCGSYRIHLLGRFLVTHNGAACTTTVRKLNGYVKVENRREMDVHTLSFVRDCVVQTTATPCDNDHCLCRVSFCS
ncbi:hypothetical protein NMY22_g5542 [Coprinellus aureogranulatus]|nr:hypothetical protein NMY22_g5542 [Coprinellus aureogranulatus]